ncbi:MAG: histidine phosphatase family protein, partial [Chloroflexi bacterium]|nr:histidine phosphatase family protein [Chloroflexota bacterium]
MTILLLIRHATNDFVKEGRLAGWTPGVHINAEGQREADALAARLAHLPIRAIYSSPLERAVDTAQAIAQCQKLDVQIREELGETQTGEWTGKLIKDINGSETWKKIQTQPVGVPLPGGESIDQVQARLSQSIDAIIAAHPHEIVAVVSHADPLKAAIAHYLGLDLNQFQRIAIDPAAVSILFFGGERPTL